VDFPAAEPKWLAGPAFSTEAVSIGRSISGLPDSTFALVGEAFSWPPQQSMARFPGAAQRTIDCEDGQRTIEPKGKGGDFTHLKPGMPKLGGVAATKEISRSILSGADGVVPLPKRFKNAFRKWSLRNHPVCAPQGGFAKFLERTATPPDS
jgi:hypothetical protein